MTVYPDSKKKKKKDAWSLQDAKSSGSVGLATFLHLCPDPLAGGLSVVSRNLSEWNYVHTHLHVTGLGCGTIE